MVLSSRTVSHRLDPNFPDGVLNHMMQFLTQAPVLLLGKAVQRKLITMMNNRAHELITGNIDEGLLDLFYLYVRDKS